MHFEILLVVMVLIAAGTDIASRRIPNALIASGLVAALMLQVFSPVGGWQTWLLGTLTGVVLLLPFYMARGMGAGDVKLMAAVGSFVGPLMAAKIVLATFLIGGVWSLVLVLWKGQWRRTWDNLCLIVRPILAHVGLKTAPPSQPVQSVARLPYGVAIALGTLSMLLLEAS